MARKAQKKQVKAQPKKKVAAPKTKRAAAVKKSAAKKKVAPKKTVVKKTTPKKAVVKKAVPKKASSARSRKNPSTKEWIEAFLFGLAVVQIQEFFRWCWGNIDKKQTRETVAALYREIFFPFESMPEHERLPIWKHAKVARFVRSLTSANATTVEKVARQWAEETDWDIGAISDGRG